MHHIKTWSCLLFHILWLNWLNNSLVVMEMADSSTHEASFCNLSIRSTPQWAPASDGEKRANWNCSGQPTIEISLQFFVQQAIFHVDFSCYGKCRKIPRYTAVGQSIVPPAFLSTSSSWISMKSDDDTYPDTMTIVFLGSSCSMCITMSVCQLITSLLI